MSHYELTIEAFFSATHALHMYDGRLEPMHGHRWRVEAYYAADALDRIGVVADFTVLSRRLESVLAPLDGRCLNELNAFASQNPSTENVARHVFERLAAAGDPHPTLARVRVWEGEGCAASYSAS